ncbi:RidA family protein [Ramlibacter humi]|uniref:RidA family protein n=1 Tax=Ramlibacter humi TaxID=2530451 RepID=A0A4Z0BHV2_9BURK|nr:RidA family protein [Ramlibacter humi]TFY98895.1 RidA family protein [Ramlibacter humi]
MIADREATLFRLAHELGLDPDAEQRIGGIYTPVVVHNGTAWVSGQVPRVGNEVIAVGRVPDQAPLELAKKGARVSALRALILVRQAAGGLDRIAQVLRMGVYVHSAPDFGGHSEVGDAASEVLYSVLGPQAGRHSRTSVGVAQLPKSASVEIELAVALQAEAGDGR